MSLLSRFKAILRQRVYNNISIGSIFDEVLTSTPLTASVKFSYAITRISGYILSDDKDVTLQFYTYGGTGKLLAFGDPVVLSEANGYMKRFYLDEPHGNTLVVVITDGGSLATIDFELFGRTA